MALCVFFFSSRRRHTRYIGDWSSDVCSYDLDEALQAFRNSLAAIPEYAEACDNARRTAKILGRGLQELERCGAKPEIGRASCRERGQVPVVGGVGEQRRRERDVGVVVRRYNS